MPNASRISDADDGEVTCNRREEDSFLGLVLLFLNPTLLFSDDFVDLGLLVFLLIFSIESLSV